jgi:hypothetical protein
MIVNQLRADVMCSLCQSARSAAPQFRALMASLNGIVSSIDQQIDPERFVVFENSTQILQHGFRTSLVQKNRKDVWKQHHPPTAHFAAGYETGWRPVKVVPKLT